MATAGTDSGVETGNESNDLDDISVNVINEMGDQIELQLQDCQHSSSFDCGLNNLNFPNQSPSSNDEKDVPPPPPPTSPNICGTGTDLFQDDEDGNCVGGGGGHEFSSDSLDGMQGDPAEDCELEEEEDADGENMDEMTMDRDFNEEQDEHQGSSGHGSYTPSPPFHSTDFGIMTSNCDSFSFSKIRVFTCFLLGEFHISYGFFSLQILVQPVMVISPLNR